MEQDAAGPVGPVGTTIDAPVTVVVERFAAGGDGLGRDPDGRIVFVAGALPGETVQVQLEERHDGWSRGPLVRVDLAAPTRVEPPCPQRRLGCGGCDWQHLAPAHQLDAKLAVVRDAFRRTGRLQAEDVLEAVIAGGSVPAIGYRTTVRVIGDADGRPAFREERSDRTVPASGCLVAHPGVVALLDEIRIPAGVEATLRVSVATGERTIHVVAGRGRPSSPTGAPTVSAPSDVGVGAEAALHERIAGHRLRVSAASFFQSGPAAAELLVETVTTLVPELADARRVVDAYGGVGLFAVAAVSADAHVTVVEQSATACADAAVNLADRPATVVQSRVDRWARTAYRGAGPRRRSGSGRVAQPRPVDVVIADPARSGLGRAGVDAVAATGAATVVLVSCDPVAGARDAALLSATGYRFDGARVLDLFPHTHHVEVVTRFTREKGPDGS